MSNSKNLLQEWCQRNKLSLPSYDYTFDEKNKKWSVCVILTKDNIYTASTGSGSSKVEADMNACFAMLQTIKKKDEEKKEEKKQIREEKFNNDTLIIVDEDNCAFLLRDLQNIGCRVLPIKSKNSGGNIDVKIARKIVNSSVKDASDFYIASLAIKLFLTSEYSTIILVTKDHFGDAFLDAFTELSKEDELFKNKILHVCNNVEDIKKYLK